jgi:hypothetical protein
VRINAGCRRDKPAPKDCQQSRRSPQNGQVRDTTGRFEAAPTRRSARQFVMKPALVEPPKDTTGRPRRKPPGRRGKMATQQSFYSIRENYLPVAITEEVPVKIELVQPKVPILQSGTMNLKIVAQRKEGFKAPINLALLYTPPGMGTAGTAQIKEGENEGHLTISARNAALQKWKVCVVGSFDNGKGTDWVSTGLVDLEVAPPMVAGKIVRTFIDQGDEGKITVTLEQKIPFEGKAKLDLVSLPNGVTAESREFTKDDKEVIFAIKAASDVQPGQHKQLIAQFTIEKDGEKMVNTIAGGGILRVDKASVAKK